MPLSTELLFTAQACYYGTRKFGIARTLLVFKVFTLVSVFIKWNNNYSIYNGIIFALFYCNLSVPYILCVRAVHTRHITDCSVITYSEYFLAICPVHVTSIIRILVDPTLNVNDIQLSYS